MSRAVSRVRIGGGSRDPESFSDSGECRNRGMLACHETPEFESHQRHRTLLADRAKSQSFKEWTVKQGVVGAIVVGVACVRKALDRNKASGLQVGERLQQKTLKHPDAILIGEIGAGDEGSVRGWRARGEKRSPTECLGRAVLEEATEAVFFTKNDSPAPKAAAGLTGPALLSGCIDGASRLLPKHAGLAGLREILGVTCERADLHGSIIGTVERTVTQLPQTPAPKRPVRLRGADGLQDPVDRNHVLLELHRLV